jgi:hypothetical protein
LVNNDVYGLRVKTLYDGSKAVVFPVSATIPDQGYVLTSRGEILSGEGTDAKATVIVHKTYPYAPDVFDYGLYTPGALD